MKNKLVFLLLLVLGLWISFLEINFYKTIASKKQMEDRLSAQEGQITTLESENKRLNEQLSESKSKNLEYEALISSLNKEIESLQKEIDGLELTKEPIEQSTNDKKNTDVEENVHTEASVSDNDNNPESEDEIIELYPTPPAYDAETDTTMYYYSNYELTAYVETGSPCADGDYPVVGYTAASNDPNLWHKTIYIEGIGYRYVHDTGGMDYNVVDIYFGDYDEAIEFGRQSANIYIVD